MCGCKGVDDAMRIVRKVRYGGKEGKESNEEVGLTWIDVDSGRGGYWRKEHRRYEGRRRPTSIRVDEASV